jgi:hypothetical protein
VELLPRKMMIKCQFGTKKKQWWLINELKENISQILNQIEFKINLSFNSPVESYNDIAFDIEQYQLLDYMIYRISGDELGNANLIFENNVALVSNQNL